MLSRSFFTPGKDIGSAVFMVWVLVQSGLLSCDSTVNTDMTNCLKREETDIVLSVLDVRAYIVSFTASLDMNQVPEKLYLGQNFKQYVMKEAVTALVSE
jgi:hypothetical protein